MVKYIKLHDNKLHDNKLHDNKLKINYIPQNISIIARFIIYKNKLVL